MAMNQGSDCPRPPWVASTRELFLRGEFQRLSKPNWDKHLTRKNSLGYSPVRFTSLCHSTHTVHLEGILKEGNDHARFKGKAKLGYETLKGFPVSWWSPCITEDEKNSLTELVLKKDASNHSNDSDDWDDDSFPLCQAKSPAFQLDSSRYGPHGLIVSTSNLLQAFADYWKISTNEIEYRKLGTFSYTREWMYTVLICPPLKKLEATLS
ncbi:hypothetical protein BC832DRAFT_271867 [Gaertneriomyces semiglobifer]|nr:hypothetical protein BC832DRAFT_271867 [Gaertneriomyces semiglobifer]